MAQNVAHHQSLNHLHYLLQFPAANHLQPMSIYMHTDTTDLKKKKKKKTTKTTTNKQKHTHTHL
jgi:hypothetical protein